MTYEIEIPYSFYGGNRAAYLCRDAEIALAGPADTGKTLALLTKLYHAAYRYPNASMVIVRKQQTDIYPTVMQTFLKEVMRGDAQVEVYGGEKPQWFQFPNGSRIWIAGLDRPGKVLSGQHDVIFTNQGEELSLPDWETLTTRTTGRAGNMPYSQCILDCNPSGPTHWIKTRARSSQNPTGPLTLIESSHRDNPELFDPETGEITEQGQVRLSRLRGLTGARLARLYHGLWVSPEGAIYAAFDEARHKLASFKIPPHWPRIVGVDPTGAYIAAVWLALDPVNRYWHAYREYLEPFGVPLSEHADSLLRLSKGETIFWWCGGSPSERQPRADYQARGVPLQPPAHGDLWQGIDAVNTLISEGRLFIHDCCINLLSDVSNYRRKLSRDGQPTDAIEDKESYHSLDALRYGVVGPVQEVTRLVMPDVQIGPRW